MSALCSIIKSHLYFDSISNMRRAYYDVANNLRKSEKRHIAMQKVDHYVGDAMTALANYADLNIANKSAIAKVSLELAKVRELTQQRISQCYLILHLATPQKYCYLIFS